MKAACLRLGHSSRLALLLGGLSLLSAAGPCTKSFETFDHKWSEAKDVVLPDGTTEPYQMLFEAPYRQAYEPTEDCTRSAGLGPHAFVTKVLRDALLEAPKGSAAVDIGSGTGFLLAVFSTLTGSDVDVVGVEHDPVAAAASRMALARTAADVPAVAASWKATPTVLSADGLNFTYPERFSVMNVGFAMKELPQRFLDQSTDDAVILMPICQEPLQVIDGNKCMSRFHLFKKLNGGGLTKEAVGPLMKFFYVPATANASRATDFA